jgi:hypothetical protein
MYNDIKTGKGLRKILRPTHSEEKKMLEGKADQVNSFKTAEKIPLPRRPIRSAPRNKEPRMHKPVVSIKTPSNLR